MFNWLNALAADVLEGDILFVVAVTLLLSWLCWRAYDHFLNHRKLPRVSRFFGLCVQIGVTLMLERLYEFSRANIIVGQLTATAYSNGYKLLDFEIDHGFFVEARIERFFWPDSLLMHSVDVFYGLAHLFVTLGFLIWLYLRRNSSFSFVRNLFYLSTAIALMVYMVFPTAPPRMFTNYGFLDPSQALGFTAAGGAQLTSYTYNPFAAMPSLHLVYALIVGLSLVVVGRRWWIRAIGAVYPAVMLAVILISANHWILDAAGAVVVVAVSAGILAAGRRSASWLRAGMSRRPPLAGTQSPG
ncbi:MAG TPA: phosphatase PAP2 family protein [Chloroflexota bacterium]|nr:phosphatase PAP2 family protein [Chloroflexota bacterium]